MSNALIRMRDLNRGVSTNGKRTGEISLRELIDYVRGLRRSPMPEDFASFEKELHKRIMQVERDILGDELAKADVDVEAVVIAGATCRRVLRSTETYQSAAGPVTVARTLYKDRTDPGARSVCPLELRTGIVAGRWTPHAAEQATWVVSQMTPQTAEELFERVGNMTPSKSSLDRLPKALSERWEFDRSSFEATLREATEIPEGTVSLAVSIDGVLAPMTEGGAKEKRSAAQAEGRVAMGPAGYREVGCATISFCDADGKMLSAIRMARMPEPKKETVKTMLCQELAAILAQQAFPVVTLADGAQDNWRFFAAEIPDGVEVVDFFHAAEHLHVAIAATYGDGSLETQRRFNDLRHVLLEQPNGVDVIIASLQYMRRKVPRREKVATEHEYFKKNRHRMRYAEMKAQGFPIGSGVVEAACKTLVTQRMKQSGMRWTADGGQAILTVRGWTQSERFDRAWALLAATYKLEVTLLKNVISLRR